MQAGEHHTPGFVVGWWGWGRDSSRWGDWGGITLGKIPNADDGKINVANYHGMCIPM